MRPWIFCGFQNKNMRHKWAIYQAPLSISLWQMSNTDSDRESVFSICFQQQQGAYKYSTTFVFETFSMRNTWGISSASTLSTKHGTIPQLELSWKKTEQRSKEAQWAPSFCRGEGDICGEQQESRMAADGCAHQGWETLSPEGGRSAERAWSRLRAKVQIDILART